MKQIFISSACIKAETIRESVTTLAAAGFNNIELSGGTKFYSKYKRDLLRLQDKYELNFLVHNYFPPPRIPFVLNLASLNNDIHKQSIEHCIRAIKLSKLLGSKKYGIHAGFLIDIRLTEIGEKIKLKKIFDRKRALSRFVDGFNKLNDIANDDVTLYIENNVFSHTNKKTYKSINPFLFTDFEGYLELADRINFKPLIDLAHLKVSCNSLKIEFINQVKELLSRSDYIHLSSNDGLHDTNKSLINDYQLIEIIKNFSLTKKYITLEIYENLDTIKKNYEHLKTME